MYDESRLSPDPSKSSKVLSLRGKKCAIKICAMNANEQFIPLAFLYPGKRMKEKLLEGAPPSSIGMVSDSSFISSDLFLDYATYFKDRAKATKIQPILLIMDNHIPHCSIAAANFFRKSHLIALALILSPYSSHRMQPLDRCFFSSLKKLYANVCKNVSLTIQVE